MTTSPMPPEAASRESFTASGSLPSIHAVYEDPRRLNKWTTEYPARVGPPAEDVESARHALVARYKLSDDPSKSLDLHSIVVQSQLLKDSLARVLNNYPGVTTELERVEFNAPFECFVHRWEQLCDERDALIRRTQDGSLEDVTMQKQTATHLKLLCSTLESELGLVIREKKDLVTHGVMKYEKVWTLFEPGCLIYQQSDEQDRVYKLKTAKFTTNNGSNVYQLDCQYVDYDGTKFGYNNKTLNITEYRGTKRITDFEAYPLEFHRDFDGLKTRLIERGRIFEAYKGYHFVGYDGIAIGKTNRGEQKYNVKSRIIVDGYSFSRYSQKVTLGNIETPVLPSDNTDVNAGEETDEDCVILDRNDGQKQSPTPVGKRPTVTVNSRFMLTQEQHLVASASVRGYSVRDKKWMTFLMSSITDITWNDDAFASLVAPQEQKDLILSFAESQVQNRKQFDDFVEGKGQGIIMLLAGPPGTGKTLTAESVAEAMRAPLYSIGVTDLGVKAATMETKLQDLLEMCAKWNAVLLLDEADVFMEARSTQDLDRNKLVATFLRRLEYFEGIMFLTTNRLENMDAAFESRIHLTLNYSELDKGSRKQVWYTFLNRSARSKDSNVAAGAFSDAELEKLSKEKLNGRQIKNVLKTAQLLASKYDEGLGMGHLETVLRLRRANEKKTVGFFGGGD